MIKSMVGVNTDELIKGLFQMFKTLSEQPITEETFFDVFKEHSEPLLEIMGKIMEMQGMRFAEGVMRQLAFKWKIKRSGDEWYVVSNE